MTKICYLMIERCSAFLELNYPFFLPRIDSLSDFPKIGNAPAGWGEPVA